VISVDVTERRTEQKQWQKVRYPNKKHRIVRLGVEVAVEVVEEVVEEVAEEAVNQRDLIFGTDILFVDIPTIIQK